MKNVPIEVLDLQGNLALNGIQTALAGGAVRDIFHGREPKDYDLTVLNTGGNWHYEIDAVAWALKRLGVAYGYFDHYEATGDSVFLGCFKLAGPHPVDIILTCQNFSSPEEVACSFDLTLNKYWYDGGEIRHADDASHLTGRIEVNNPYRVSSPERIARMAAKYPEYELCVN